MARRWRSKQELLPGLHFQLLLVKYLLSPKDSESYCLHVLFRRVFNNGGLSVYNNNGKCTLGEKDDSNTDHMAILYGIA